MKRGGPDHPKVHALAAALGISRWGAVGILESMFHWASAYTPEGDVGRWGAQRLAGGIGWTDDAEKLQAALVSAGWLERGPSGAIIIHGWSEHADDATNMKLARMRVCFADGGIPKFTRLPTNERVEAEKHFRVHASVHTASKRTEPCARISEPVSVGTSLPSPPSPSLPLPSHSSPSPEVRERSRPHTAEAIRGLSGMWSGERLQEIADAYPAKRLGMVNTAIRAIDAALVEAHDLGEPDPPGMMLRQVGSFARSWAGRRGEFTPEAKTWFAGGGWKSDPSAWDRPDSEDDKPKTRDVASILSKHNDNGARK